MVWSTHWTSCLCCATLARAPRGNELFDRVREMLDSALSALPETPRGSNAVYWMRDVGVGAFGAFFLQSPSFLAHQQLMHTQRGLSDAQTLLGVQRIPSDNQICNQLEPVASTAIYPPFDQTPELARQQGALERLHRSEGHSLAVLDGRQYFGSTQIRCPQSSRTEPKEGPMKYSHMAIAGAMVAPRSSPVLRLVPEFVRQPEREKVQDCELAAGQRRIEANGQRYRHLGLTILTDDKYANHPTRSRLAVRSFTTS